MRGGSRMGGRFPGSLVVWWWAGDLRSIADRARKKKREISICSMTARTMGDGMAGRRCVRRVYVEPIW